MKIELGKTYFCVIDEEVKRWEFNFTPTRFLTTGMFAGGYEGVDEYGYDGIVMPEEFVGLV